VRVWREPACAFVFVCVLVLVLFAVCSIDVHVIYVICHLSKNNQHSAEPQSALVHRYTGTPDTAVFSKKNLNYIFVIIKQFQVRSCWCEVSVQHTETQNCV